MSGYWALEHLFSGEVVFGGVKVLRLGGEVSKTAPFAATTQ
jgi:hypothetical protein